MALTLNSIHLTTNATVQAKIDTSPVITYHDKRDRCTAIRGGCGQVETCQVLQVRVLSQRSTPSEEPQGIQTLADRSQVLAMATALSSNQINLPNSSNRQISADATLETRRSCLQKRVLRQILRLAILVPQSHQKWTHGKLKYKSKPL